MLSSTLPVSLLAWLGACIVAVSATVTIDEPVDTVDVALGVGELTVVAESGPVVLEADLGGLADSELDYRVHNKVLYVDATCAQKNLCGGSLDITMPGKTALVAQVGTGSVALDGLADSASLGVGTGDVTGSELALTSGSFDVDVGNLDLSFRRAPGALTVTVTTGDVSVVVPKGAYDLQLDAQQVSTRGVTDDADAPSLLRIHVGAGRIDVVGR